MAIGVKSTSTLSTAYQNALTYTKERVQGADLARGRDPAAPRVRIVEHPDVRRMLMLQKAWAEGLRGLCFFTAHLQDQVEVLGGHGAAEARELDRLNDLLLPVVKGVASEKVYELLGLALQCYGGSGYMRDYPVEQYIRDQKIDTLYEGTTHIQALDLFFRKVAKDGGQTLRSLLGRVRETLDRAEGGDSLTREREALARALADVEAIFLAMLGKVRESLYHVGLHGNRILMALGELVVGWLLVRQAALALDAIEGASDADRSFYAGKLAAARFFAAEVLPGVATARKVIEGATLDLMSVPEDAF
jgi:hypothetical protein